MSSLDYLDLCRLCLVKDRVSVPIFEGEGDVRQIFLKITACLPVKVDREDKLPKKICDDCVYKVELFYQFWNTTVNAEKQLLQWLGEVGLEDKPDYVTNVLNQNVMKTDPNGGNRLDGSMMQQVSGHQNNMGMGMMDNISLSIPMMMPTTNQQQMTSVPMDTSGSSVQNVQEMPGTSNQPSHEQIAQSQTSTSNQHEEDEESSEEEENSEDECDGEEGLPVKEESEEDPNNSRAIEPTTFVNVSLACDEAGPSGLQQQKVAEMPEMAMQQSTDGDPKSGFMAQDPLDQSYLVVQKSDQYFLVPVLSGCLSEIDEEIDSSMQESKIKVEVIDDYSDPDTQNPWMTVDDEPSKLQTKVNSVFICHVCRKFFESNLDLLRHARDHNVVQHVVEEPVNKCPLCDRSLKSQRTLRLHMKLHENDPEIHHCADCEFESQRLANVKRHSLRKHSRTFRFHCPHCPRKTNFKTDFNKHVRKHSNTSNCIVQQRVDNKSNQNSCSKNDTDPFLEKQRRLRRRKWRGNGSKKRTRSIYTYKCPQCKWCFRDEQMLQRHLERHLLRFPCNKCGMVFKYRGSFLKHVEAHEERNEEGNEEGNEEAHEED